MVAKFHYDQTPLPAYGSKDYDHWGYYNGRNNTTNIPSYGAYIGANRSPNLTYTQAGVLTAIEYPTGGKTEYDYELNRYLYGAAEENAGGLRIKEIRQRNDSNVQSTKYEYLINNKSSGTRRCELILGYSVFRRPSSTTAVNYSGPTNDHTPFVVYSKPTNDLYGIEGRYVTYSCVTEINPDKSKTRYYYTKSESNSDIYSDRSSTMWEYSDGSVMHANAGSRRGALSGIQPTSRFWRRNLLHTLERLDAANNLIEKQVYTYELQEANRSEVSAYIPYSPPNPFVARTNLVCEYKWESQPIYLKKIENVATPYNPASTTVFTYNTEYMVPTQTEQTDAEDNRIKTIIKYPFNYPNATTSPSTCGLYHLRLNGIVTPVETVVSRNDKVVGANVQVFTTKTINTQEKALPWKQYALPVQTSLNNFSSSNASSSDFTFDSRYELQSTNTDFDQKGRVLTWKTPTGELSAVIYNDDQPVAVVENTRYAVPESTVNNVSTSLFLDDYPGQTEIFAITHEQTVCFEIHRSHYSIGSEVSCFYRIKKESGDVVFTYENVAEAYSGEDIAFSTHLPAGRYYCTAEIEGPYSGNAHIEISMITENITPVYNRMSQVFHTSFEDHADGMVTNKAKTGHRVYNKSYSIDLQNFAPGTYLLSYWKSTNLGNTWEKVTEDISVTSYSTNKLIGGSFYIDEVRIHPADARMKTFTYEQGIGKTSEMDHNGKAVYYQYDSHGRLQRVLDQDGKVLEQYDYHYANQ